MKKIISSILLCFMLLLVGISGVSAATKDVEITEFKLQSKSSTATVENISLDKNNKVTGTITLNKVDDFVSFNLTIKNNSNGRFKIINVEDNNKIDNIALVYQYDENYINSGQSASVTIKLRYDKELSGQNKLSLDDLNIKINFETETGSHQSIVVNPATGDSIIRFIIIAIASIVGAFLLVVKRKRKIGMLLLILASIVLPFAALANEKYEINIRFTNIDIMGKEEVIPVNPDYATLKDGNTFQNLISSGTGAFRMATAEEYNAVKDSLTDANIASTNSSPAPVYLWDSNGDILYYSEAPVIYMNEDAGNMFKDVNLTTIDLSGLDSSKVTDMSYMFANLKGTTFVDLSKLDTSSATTMVGMFTGIGHSGLDLSTFDTSNVVNMSGMFSHSETLEEVNLSSFNTSKVTDMSNMFNGSSMLTGLDLNNFNTSKVTNMSGMFAGCSKVETINLSSFDTSKVTDMTSMFENCTKLETIYASNLWDMTGVQNSDDMFKGDENLLGQEGTEYEPSNNSAHYACLDEGVNDPGYFSEVGHVSTVYSNLVDGYEFKDKARTIVGYYKKLKELDMLGYFTNPTNSGDDSGDDSGNDSGDDSGSYGCGSGSGSYGCGSGSYGCGSGPSFDPDSDNYGDEVMCQSYDPDSGYDCNYYIPDYGSSFYDDIEEKTFRKATKTEYKNAKYFLDKRYLISTAGSPNPTYLWVEGDVVVYYSVSKKIYLNPNSSEMFYDSDYESIDLSGMDSSHVTDMSNMFRESRDLKNVNLDGFDTSNVADMSEMFEYCNSLTVLDLSSFSVDSVTDADSMFYGCESLQTIYASDLWNSRTDYDSMEPGFYSSSMFSGCNSLLGQLGTSYAEEYYNGAYNDYNYDNAFYANVDGKDGHLGYFSDKNSKVAMFAPGTTVNNKLQEMNTSGKSFRKATAAEYNEVSESLTEEANLVSINNNQPIYMWETNDSVLYYSAVTSIYLNRNASDMFKNTGFTSINLGGITSSFTTSMVSMFEDCTQLTDIVFEDSTAGQVAEMNNKLSASVMNANSGKIGAVPIIFAVIFAVIALIVGVLLFREVQVNKLKLSVGVIAVIVVAISLSVLLWDSGLNKLLASVSGPEETTTVATVKFDTSQVNSMTSMFENCSSLEELDLTSFSNDNVYGLNSTFANCTKLKRIYVSELWDNTRLINGSVMDVRYTFDNCPLLVGGNGTKYNSEIIDGEYARVDEGYKRPGYLTLKGQVVNNNYAYFVEGYSFNYIYDEIDEPIGCTEGDDWVETSLQAKTFRKATEEEYNSMKPYLSENNIVSDPNSPALIYMWKIKSADDLNNTMVYYSEAATVYMNVYSNYMFEWRDSLVTIDLSEINYAATTEFSSMFRDCTSLKTIYVSSAWDDLSIADGDSMSMFEDCESLVGGAGTTFDSNYVRGEYARIDGGPSKPGYLTVKQ